MSWIRRILHSCAIALMMAAGLAPGMLATLPAFAQTEKVLFPFTGGATGFGASGLIMDETGNLYGAAVLGGGGHFPCTLLGLGCGVIYKISPAGREVVLHSFTGGTDGDLSSLNPSNLTLDAQGNLYGATQTGGAGGNGVVFKVDPAGGETILYTFPRGSAPAQGAWPNGGLLLDKAGNLYGTTVYGGGNGNGVVFRLDSTGNEKVLYDFKGYPTAGSNPSCCLIRDSAGNLYGTTASGGSSGSGTLFELSPSGKETVLYSFAGGTDGAGPNGGLVRDAAGNLYGTTSSGGSYGYGTVFKISPAGKEIFLYSFTGASDGAFPNAGLVRDAAGNLYGTTELGAISFNGVVFKVNAAGRVTVLYSFTGGMDGGNPSGSLATDQQGNIYGVTNNGGRTCVGSFGFGTFGCGVVYQLAVE